ncbi:Holliday junction branch migration protein RuvA [Hydrogenimonas sp. SS33]|uniref:Holliday junction branch migration protein RuvA n=1 Tax=Hydrogenimonas leucolamina TaxID=2954236 RepID=UPI00336BE887
MIVGIHGKVLKKDPTHLHILTAGGLVYEVFVSLQCSASIKSDEVQLLTTHIVREDAQQLYGFGDINEKRMFDTLIKISGVGPKVAMAICSTFSPLSFAKIVESKDVGMLKQVPGIGPKSAGRILVELSGFSLELAGEEAAPAAKAHQEAAMALESLGFKKEQIAKALKGCGSDTTEGLIKEALKKLSQGSKRK